MFYVVLCSLNIKTQYTSIEVVQFVFVKTNIVLLILNIELFDFKIKNRKKN